MSGREFRPHDGDCLSAALGCLSQCKSGIAQGREVVMLPVEQFPNRARAAMLSPMVCYCMPDKLLFDTKCHISPVVSTAICVGFTYSGNFSALDDVIHQLRKRLLVRLRVQTMFM